VSRKPRTRCSASVRAAGNSRGPVVPDEGHIAGGLPAVEVGADFLIDLVLLRPPRRGRRRAACPLTPCTSCGTLRDADLLRQNLMAVRDGALPLWGAVADYERQMLDYGFTAVARFLHNARLAGSGNRLQRAALRTALRAIDHIPGAGFRALT
jgi:hypothetical protein